MGIQGAAVRALGVSDISTTYITGTWTGLISGLVRQHHPTASGKKRVETRLQADSADCLCFGGNRWGRGSNKLVGKGHHYPGD